MQVELLDIFKTMIESYNVNFAIISSGNIKPDFDLGLRKSILQDWECSKMTETIYEHAEPGICYCIIDAFGSEYFMFSLPEQETGDYVLIGPYRKGYVEEYELNNLLQTQKIPMELMAELTEYYQAVPVILNYESWASFIQRVMKQLYSIDGELKIRYMDSGLWHETMDFRREQPTTTLAVKLIEERYRIEGELLQAITMGNMDAALKTHSKFRGHQIAKRYKDPVRDLRNLLIVSNSLYRKAVEAGCVHPAHIDELSCRFAKKIETVCTSQEASNMGIEMVRKYCMTVKNYSVRGYSPLIQKVINHIDLNLPEELSLKHLANEYNVNASYLSVLFKKERNMTITAYISQQRMKQAILYLNTSNMQVQNIAAYVGVLDVNYFSKIFKKYTGKTPSEYREQILGKKQF